MGPDYNGIFRGTAGKKIKPGAVPKQVPAVSATKKVIAR
jgi:hypothetical protein